MQNRCDYAHKRAVLLLLICVPNQTGSAWQWTWVVCLKKIYYAVGKFFPDSFASETAW